jgi:hypothetical protein
MKRESKAYSFKEQQEEMQLRKELEEKKKKAGLIKAPELSDKQKEVMRIELEKETAIRMKLQKVSYYFALPLLYFVFNANLVGTLLADERTIERGNVTDSRSGHRKRSFVIAEISFSTAYHTEEHAIPAGR